MRPGVPSVLAGTAWEPWLLDCPHHSEFRTIDDFRRAFETWADGAPGHNAVPSASEAAALAAWLTRFEIDLIDIKIGDVDLQQGPLGYAFVSLIGAVMGAAASASLGAAAAAVAAGAIAIGLAAIGLLFAISVVKEAARKGRANRILSRMRTRVRALADKFW